MFLLVNFLFLLCYALQWLHWRYKQFLLQEQILSCLSKTCCKNHTHLYDLGTLVALRYICQKQTVLGKLNQFVESIFFNGLKFCQSQINAKPTPHQKNPPTTTEDQGWYLKYIKMVQRNIFKVPDKESLDLQFTEFHANHPICFLACCSVL